MVSAERFKIYSTQNIHNYLKLDTWSGAVSQIQDDGQSWSIVPPICLPSIGKECKNDGRYSLVETENIWTYLLLDQISGKVWQVQFSIEDNRGYYKINEDDLRADKDSKDKIFTLTKTKNIWTYILCNTVTGKMYKVQFSVSGDEYRWIKEMQ